MRSARLGPASRGGGEFDHDAFVYRSTDELAEFGVAFVESGLATGGEVFIAGAAAGVAALRAALGGEPAGVSLRNTSEWAPHPATRLRAFHRLVTSRLRAGVPTLHLMGEPLWPSGPPAIRMEWARYESVLNAVLAPFPVTLVCLYDGLLLAPELVADAGRTHPEFVDAAGARPTGAFEPPATLLRQWTPEAAPPPAGATVLADPQSPTTARGAVTEAARRVGVDAPRTEDLGIAVSEVLTNAALHAGGATRVAMWTEAGRFVCQVDDAGPGMDDPLAGYRPPSPDEVAGRGLWLARQLVELLQIMPGGSAGTTVRLHVPLGAARAA